MSDVQIVGAEIRKGISELLVTLQTKRRVNPIAFEGFHEAVKQLAVTLKGSDSLPKALVNEVFVTMQTLRREAAHDRRNAEILNHMANEIEMTFGLILKGECHEDRVAGVPRII